jgi:O-antigen/teichoic acid export membrane protein
MFSMEGESKRTLLLSVRYATAGIGRQAFNFLLFAVWAHYLSPSDFGVLALLVISGTLVLRSVETPVGYALQRFYFRPDYVEKRDVLLFNLLLFVIANALAVLLLYYVVGQTVARWVLKDAELGPTVRLHGWWVAFSITTSLSGVFAVLLERVRIFNTASLLGVIATGVVSIGLLTTTQLGVQAVIIGQAAGLLLQTLVCLPALRGRLRPELNWNVLREPLRFGYAALPSGYSNILIIAGDRYVLQFLKTVYEVGLYSFACNIGNLVTLAIGTPVIGGVWPTIRRMEANPERQRAFVRQTTTFVCAASIALVVFLSVFSAEAIRLLAWKKPEYAAAACVIPLLAFSQALQGLAAFTEAGISLGNRPAYISGIALTSAAANIGLNFLLVPKFGLLGAGWATLGSFVLWNSLHIYFSRRFYRLQFDVRRFAHAALIGAMLIVTAQMIPAELSLLILCPLKAALVLAYPVLLLATGFLMPDERQRLSELARGARRGGIRSMVGARTQS